jgi:hypothetical protein
MAFRGKLISILWMGRTLVSATPPAQSCATVPGGMSRGAEQAANQEACFSESNLTIIFAAAALEEIRSRNLIILRKARLALVLCLALWAACTTDAQETHWASLQLALIRVQNTSARPRFRVAFRNAEDQPLMLYLGTMLADGRKQYPDRVHLLLTDVRGKVLELDMKPLGRAVGLAGQLVPMLVPLPVGATFAFPVDLEDYYAPKETIWNLDLPPGRYTLSAEYTGVGVPQRAAAPGFPISTVNSHYWSGTVNSNTLPFTLSREIGKQHGQ